MVKQICIPEHPTNHVLNFSIVIYLLPFLFFVKYCKIEDDLFMIQFQILLSEYCHTSRHVHIPAYHVYGTAQILKLRQVYAQRSVPRSVKGDCGC